MRATAYDDYKDRLYRGVSEKAIVRQARVRERLYTRLAGYLGNAAEGLLDNVAALSSFDMAEELGDGKGSYSSVKFINLVVAPLIKALKDLELINPANANNNPTGNPEISNAVKIIHQHLGVSFNLYDRDIRSSLEAVSPGLGGSEPSPPGGSDE